MLDFDKEIAPIGGWLTKDEGIFLYESARKILPGYIIVEIGSWKGRSTICFGKGVKDGRNATIQAIDPHTGSSEHHKMFGKVDTFDEFISNIKKAGVDQFITPVREKSEVAVRNFTGPIGFLLIDGSHDIRDVKIDYKIWFDGVVDKGIVAFHDSWSRIGPNIVTALILLTSSQIKNPKLVDTLTVFEKCEKNSFLDRIKNVLFLIYKELFGWIGTLKIDYKGTVLK